MIDSGGWGNALAVVLILGVIVFAVLYNNHGPHGPAGA